MSLRILYQRENFQWLRVWIQLKSGSKLLMPSKLFRLLRGLSSILTPQSPISQQVPWLPFPSTQHSSSSRLWFLVISSAQETWGSLAVSFPLFRRQPIRHVILPNHLPNPVWRQSEIPWEQSSSQHFHLCQVQPEPVIRNWLGQGEMWSY